MRFSVTPQFAFSLPAKNQSQDVVFFKLLLAAILALLVAYLINRIVSRLLPLIAKAIAARAQARDRMIETKRAETMLSVAAAITRAVVVGLCLFAAWRFVNPTSAPVAIIGASTFFVVLGAATIGPLLRDLTSGTLMIIEKWYNVGDHIVVDPFMNLAGVVEEVNLRSTKLRSLNGEIIWIHNQNIQAVRVTPRGVRTISIDTFVSDRAKGRKLIENTIATLPTGPTMIASPLQITEEEEHGNVWRITAEGQTAPGREWLIENFAVKAIEKADVTLKEPVIVHSPVVRYTDAAAERRFIKAVQSKNKGRRKK